MARRAISGGDYDFEELLLVVMGARRNPILIRDGPRLLMDFPHKFA